MHSYLSAGMFQSARETFMVSELHCMFSAAVENAPSGCHFYGRKNWTVSCNYRWCKSIVNKRAAVAAAGIGRKEEENNGWWWYLRWKETKSRYQISQFNLKAATTQVTTKVMFEKRFEAHGPEWSKMTKIVTWSTFFKLFKLEITKWRINWIQMRTSNLTFGETNLVFQCSQFYLDPLRAMCFFWKNAFG